MLKRTGLVMLASATSCIAPSAHAQVSAGVGSATSAVMEEIIVTAQKRGEERLQDVPVPITAIKAENLADNNQLRVQDYYTQIPNFSVAPSPDVGNSQILQIRGITTGIGSSPTVGIVLDDVPLGITGNTIPDLDPSDLAQIEVLRGPQGSLFGSASMGGLLRYVTRDPSTDKLTGRVQVGVSGVENGASVGYMARGAINLPLSDTMAIRASAFTRMDPGYIDNPMLGIDGINEQKNSGGRIAGLWRPSDAFTVKFSALIQKLATDGSGYATVLPGMGDMEQNFIRGVGIFDQTVQAYSLTLEGKIGSFDLTSLTGYNRMEFTNSLDISYLYGPFSAGIFGPAFAGATVSPDSDARSFTQEVRLSTAIGSRLSWRLGGFYSGSRSTNNQDYPGVNPLTGEIGGYLIQATSLNHAYERAIFTDLTANVTDQFDVQVGARESWLKGVADYQRLTGALYGDGINNPYTENTSKAFTYLLTPRYRFTPDLMAYARLASGFRPGGGVSNPSPTATCVVLNLPCDYGPDKTKNYEVGVKGSVLDGKLTFDASVYYIDWTGIQILLTDPSNGFPYTTNGGKAKSQGAEISVVARPLEGLSVSAWVTLSDAVLAQDFPANSSAYGKDGDRLPNSSRRSASLAIEHHFDLNSNATGFVGGTLSYIGDMLGVFQPTPDRQRFAGYAKLDLRGGINHESWAFNFYLNNATDKRVAIGGGLGTFPPYAFGYIQPRNYGVSVARNF